MTPADYGAEAEGDGDGSEESSSESSDGEPLSLDAYDPDPGQVQKLRPTGNEDKKQVCWQVPRLKCPSPSKLNFELESETRLDPRVSEFQFRGKTKRRNKRVGPCFLSMDT